MKFEYREVEIPVLSWAAIFERNKENVQILHGPWVETREDYFIEGAWDGEYEKGDFEHAYSLMGFGGKIRNGKALFCCPCHPLERLNLYRDEDRLIVTPSLAFLLKLTGQRLDHGYAFYYWDFLTFVRKMENHVGRIRTQEGKIINVVHFRDVEIDRELNIRIRMKSNPPEFRDYASYIAYLHETLKKIQENAASSLRSVKYDALCTISTGYDSPACAAIAVELGCYNTVTHRTSDEDRRQYHLTGDDSGQVIAEKLKMNAEVRDPKAYLGYHGMPEAEFAATGYDDEALVMSSFEQDFRQKLVITGMHGENVWNRVSKTPVAKNMFKMDGCGCSLSEFRYRVGFIHVPLPFCGAIRHPSIYKITNSDEMALWTLRNGYDRPIPRRLVEEKGVERDLFGQEKLFLLPVYLGSDREQLKKKMTATSCQSFEEYCRDNQGRLRVRDIMNLSAFIAHKLYLRILYALTGRKDLARIMGCPVPEKYRVSPLRRPYLFHWGLSVVQRSYKVNDSSRT